MEADVMEQSLRGSERWAPRIAGGCDEIHSRPRSSARKQLGRLTDDQEVAGYNRASFLSWLCSPARLSPLLGSPPHGAPGPPGYCYGHREPP